MTNLCKKKRRAIFVKETKPPEMNDVFFRNLKIEILNQYETSLKSHFEKMNLTQELIMGAEELKKDNKKCPNQQKEHFILAHQKIAQISLIESISIFDFHINHALEEYQKYKHNKRGKEIRSYWKVEDGIGTCLKGQNLSSDFTNIYTRVKYFRKLRHKFAHGISCSVGMVLFIEPKDEDFESSFLERLDGVVVNKNSFWVQSAQSEGRGFVVYRINSDKFIYLFFDESILFFKIFLDLLFPTEAKWM